MSYFKKQTYGTRVAVSLDGDRLLTDLVSALGGSNVDPGYQGGSFTVGELAIYIRAGYGAKARRVTISSGIADRKAHQRAYASRSIPSFPTITVDPDRGVDVITKDIRKRVIEASAGALAAIHAASNAQSETFASLQNAAERLNARFPGTVTLPDDDTNREASFYLNGGGCYLSGRLNAEGWLYVDRLGTVPAHKLERLVALLAEA